MKVKAPTSRSALVLAAILCAVVGTFVPFGRLLLYPFTLMATWVHEMGHGVTALLVGGSFSSLAIFGDAAGVAYTTSPPAHVALRGVVSAGGLLAPPIVGAAMLATARGPKRARIVLVVLGAAMLASLAIWVRSIAGFVAIPIVAVIVSGFAIWGSPRERMFLAQFLGLRLALDTMTRGLDYLFAATATVDGKELPSDIATVAASWGGPRFFWSLVISAIAIAFVAVGLWAAWRKPTSPARGRAWSGARADR